MDFEWDPGLWAPQLRSVESVVAAWKDTNRLLLFSPTGSGKTRMCGEIFRWANHHGKRAIFYANRKLLIGQTDERFSDLGLDVGIRAADYDHRFDDTCPVQIASADTERARVFKGGKWDFFDVGEGGIVAVDEAHLQKTKVMKDILQWYEKRGAKILLLTATPVAMGGMAERLLVGGRLSEWRSCGALVPVYTYNISQPDMRKVKRNNTGEFVMDDGKKMEYLQTIVGEVIENWELLNDGSPTMCYAPGVPESIWLAEKFRARGHEFVHVDATDAYIGGKRVKMTQQVWHDILSGVKSGDIRGLSSRFKLREGVDIPTAGHCVLATPVGSLASYLQILGRVMRSAPGKTQAILQDHGGCLDSDTEVLTKRGWVGRTEIQDSDMVAAFDIDTREISWQPILNRHDRELDPGERMFTVKNGRLDIRVTGNHKAVYQQRTMDKHNKPVWPIGFKLGRFENIIENARMKFPLCGHQTFPGVELSDAELTMLGWWITDGTLSSGSARRQFVIEQKAEYAKHIKSIRAALAGCGLHWTESSKWYKRADGSRRKLIVFRVPKGTCKSRPRNGWIRYEKWLDKDIHPDLDAMTSRQFDVFLKAIHLGDGAKDRKKGAYKIACGNKAMADRLQSMAVRRGWKCNCSKVPGRMLWNMHMQQTEVTTVHGQGCNDTQCRIQSEEPVPGERVWCIANPLKTLIVRRNGKVVVIGNCYHLHGSPNLDRPWEALWQVSESAASTYHQDLIREGQIKEPIRCPACGMERTSGSKCPGCGHEAAKGKRAIRMETGELSEIVEGPMIKPRRRVMKATTAEDWAKMFWGFKRKKVDRSFAQMEAYFCREHGYLPPRDLPYMPKHFLDWKAKVHQVEFSDLIHSKDTSAKGIDRRLGGNGGGK